MSFHFHKTISVQSLSSLKSSGTMTGSSISSASEDNQKVVKFSPPKFNQSQQICENLMEQHHDQMFVSVKQWFAQKNIKFGNPEEIIQKAKKDQRQAANSKIVSQKQEASLTSSGLRERRLKRGLTLIV